MKKYCTFATKFLYTYMTVTKKVKYDGLPWEGHLGELIVQALLEKQGDGVVCIDLRKVNHALFDYYIICSGNSKAHIQTLCDFVQEKTQRSANVRPLHVEGLENCEWVLLDYADILVHIFRPEAREYYNIEALWSDAGIQKF